MQRYRSRVRWFDNAKGYGFIEVPGRKDAFVHYSAIQSDEEVKKLKPGEEVEFEVVESSRGLMAQNVRRRKGR